MVSFQGMSVRCKVRVAIWGMGGGCVPCHGGHDGSDGNDNVMWVPHFEWQVVQPLQRRSLVRPLRGVNAKGWCYAVSTVYAIFW